MDDTAPSWPRRIVIAAIVFALAVMTAALIVRGLWRDEYWALYYSDPRLDFASLVQTRMVGDVHPPFYFSLLHAWRLVSESTMWARAFTFPILLIGAVAAWFLGRSRPTEAAAFLLLCASSYWVMNFGVEVRMYLFVFTLCALSVLIVRNALDEGPKLGDLVLYALIGAAAATSHYFAALWFGALGLCAGLSSVRRGKVGAFLGWGIASVIAVAPVTAWAWFTRPDETPGAGGDAIQTVQQFVDALEQFLRGLIVKTFGSNLAATIAAFLCLGALIRRRNPIDGVLFFASVLVVVIAFVIHMLWVPLIKERAFIVIMPAVIMLGVRAMGTVGEEQKRARWFIRAVPFFALAAPILFSPEIFKDREKWGEARKVLAEEGVHCAGAPVLTFYRPSEQAEDISEYTTRLVLAGAANGGDVVLVDAAKAAPGSAVGTECRVKAMALNLPRGERDEHKQVREAFTRAGLDLTQLEERNLGGGRQLIYLAKEPAK